MKKAYFRGSPWMIASTRGARAQELSLHAPWLFLLLLPVTARFTENKRKRKSYQHTYRYLSGNFLRLSRQFRQYFVIIRIYALHQVLV